jgi:hypothetical protein
MTKGEEMKRNFVKTLSVFFFVLVMVIPAIPLLSGGNSCSVSYCGVSCDVTDCDGLASCIQDVSGISCYCGSTWAYVNCDGTGQIRDGKIVYPFDLIAIDDDWWIQ